MREELTQAFENIKEGREVRRNLIELKGLLKEAGGDVSVWEPFEKEPSVLPGTLKQEDAKARKNGALVLGILGSLSGEDREGEKAEETKGQAFLRQSRDALLKAYAEETQRFVKSAYLTALRSFDCRDCLEVFRERRQALLKEERTAENEKHLREELGELNALLAMYEKPQKHRFTGYEEETDLILTTYPGFQELTERQVETAETVRLKAGVKVLRGKTGDLLSIRTFRELLFCLDTREVQAETAAKGLAESNFLELLVRLHEGGAPFRFRIECRSRMSLEKRSLFTKKLAAELETLTGGRLVNSTSDYEAELRLIETKTGGFFPLLKLYTLPDKRFSYRKNSVAASMQPVQAALLMELARPWMKEEARVLDPFCGVGTLLLERNYLAHADTLYGVDIYGEAIEKARENAEIARVTAHYVNRDFLDFTHEYPFDELVTNMPVKGGKRTAHEIAFLHEKLFERAEELLCRGGMIFLYSHDRSFVKKGLREHKSMELVKEWKIGDREDSWFFVIRYV